MKITTILLGALASAAVVPLAALPIPAPLPFSEQERSEIDALRLRGVPEADVYARITEVHQKYGCPRGVNERKGHECRRFGPGNGYEMEMMGEAMFGGSQELGRKVELRGVDVDLSRYEERRKRIISRPCYVMRWKEVLMVVVPRGPAKHS
ncbi:MAG: hypothetical protein M1835_006309 [Candelina submexicana]|nr:MAG: hypothetical protein M1835_006309 [Candelina submexicana]